MPARRRRWVWSGAALVLVAAAVWGLRTLPLQGALVEGIDAIRRSPWGVPVFSAVYVVSTVLLLPASLLTLIAGFLYGPGWGVLLVSPVSVLAALAAFGIGRTVGRAWVTRRLAGSPKLSAIDEAVGREGLKIVLLLRLSPVLPFNLLNYALALTRVRFRDYFVGSLVGMLPGTVLYVYLGSLVTSATALVRGEHPDAGPWGTALYWGGLAATLVATVIITRVAHRALQQALTDGQPPREAT